MSKHIEELELKPKTPIQHHALSSRYTVVFVDSAE